MRGQPLCLLMYAREAAAGLARMGCMLPRRSAQYVYGSVLRKGDFDANHRYSLYCRMEA